MLFMRALIRQRPALVLAMVLTALFFRLTVPAGFMVRQQAGVMTLEICGGTAAGVSLEKLVIPKPAGGGASHNAQPECPFAALGMAGLAGADPALLAVALAFIFLLGFAPVSELAQGRLLRLRPPLRGPPGA
jgi:hypothetical protein